MLRLLFKACVVLVLAMISSGCGLMAEYVDPQTGPRALVVVRNESHMDVQFHPYREPQECEYEFRGVKVPAGGAGQNYIVADTLSSMSVRGVIRSGSMIQSCTVVFSFNTKNDHTYRVTYRTLGDHCAAMLEEMAPGASTYQKIEYIPRERIIPTLGSRKWCTPMTKPKV